MSEPSREPWSKLASAAAVALVLGACRSGPELPVTDGSWSERSVEELVTHRDGPPVRLGSTGPARVVPALFDAFDVERTMEVVAGLDALVRSPGSPGFDAALDRIAEALRAAGFGDSGPLRLEELRTPMEQPAWIPRSGRAAILLEGGGERVLHAFDDPADRDRSMLVNPVGSFELEGAIAFELEGLDAGEILVTRTRVDRRVVNRAQSGGAIAVVSASLQPYNVDPTGRERHVDAIQHRVLSEVPELPIVQISERSMRLLEQQMLRAGEVRLALDATVELGAPEQRTLVATIEGAARPEEAVVLVSHVMDPGAADNASGAAGQLECALAIARLIGEGALQTPARSLVFLWGAEYAASEAWLAATPLQPFVAVNAVMIGESRAETGARALLERYPDPGAVRNLPPDTHTLWGAREVREEWLAKQNGLSVVARCALVDVAQHSGGWETSENPYEGGTDHETFIEAGVPAVLFWHFTDFTFHTSLDRLEIVDPEELRRMAVAAAATALAVADPQPADLERYLKCNRDELFLRVSAAEEAHEAELAEAWEVWCTGARHWLRALCLPAAG